MVGKERIVWGYLQRICVLVFILMFASLFIQGEVAQAAHWTLNIFGKSRLDTAIEISKTGWESGAENVILARADNPADALSSASLSGKADAPILLTYPNTLEQSVIDEIHRLGASKVYILGGYGAVSAEVEKNLTDLGLTVTRLGGSTRFETAALINKEAGTSVNSQAIIVNGYATADALSAASRSANYLVPIYLSTKTALPLNLPATVKEVTIYGGEGVIGKEVASSLTKKGIKVTRIAGVNRYDTNIKAADTKLGENVIFVRGTSVKAKIEDYPDAVAGAGLSRKLKANIILIDPNVVVPEVVKYLSTYHPPNFYVLGGGIAGSYVMGIYYQIPDAEQNNVFNFDINDADIDPVKPIVYFLSSTDNSLKSYNYVTKELKSIAFSKKPEALYVRKNKVYVTLVNQAHDPYWQLAYQQGGLVVVNTDTFTLEKNFKIYLDPFDIVADDNGMIYVSGGSGQWTRLKSYSSITGAEASSMMIREKSYIDITPDQSKIFAVTTDGFPIYTTSFLLDGGKVVDEQKAPDHGTYKLGKLIKVSPDGKYLFNNYGNVFTNNQVFVTKLETVTSNPYTAITFNLEQNRFFTAFSDTLTEYDYTTMKPVYTYKTKGMIMKTFYQNNKIIIVTGMRVLEILDLSKITKSTK